MMRTKLVTTLLILALVLTALPPWHTAQADDVTVTTTSDALDAAGGSCGAVTPLLLPGPDGVTSLRALPSVWLCRSRNAWAVGNAPAINGACLIASTVHRCGAASHAPLSICRVRMR